MKDPLLPTACAINSWQQNSPDVFTLELSPPADYQAFTAGQFNMLYIPGAGEAAISISGDPADADVLVHTVRSVGNVTRLLQQQRPPQQIGMRGPFGRGWPLTRAEGGDLVILAGGIGLAPLRPVLYQALARRERFRNIFLLVGARSPGEILYREQLLSWKKFAALQLLVSVDVADPGWRGDVGVITELIPRIDFDPDNTVAMICGPEIMMRFCVSKLRDKGLNDEAIFVSLERNMKCAVGFCGHCQLGPHFVCKDGPVFSYPEVEHYLLTREF